MSAVDLLDKDWAGWLTTNIEKKVAIPTLANTLFSRGWTDAAICLMQEHDHQVHLPMLDFSKNNIQLSDKQVELLFTCTKPYVAVINHFLTEEECTQLIASADDKLQKSRVVNPDDGSFVTHYARTSTSTGFARGANALIDTIEQRIAEILSWPVDHGEGLQVLRYEDGGEYLPHYDYFDVNKNSGKVVMQKGGQRVGTFLMYLSDVEAGGATRFPLMNFEVRPKMGMALYFGNTCINNEPDTQTMHSSVPVVSGVKYLATKWLREKPYV